MERKASEALRRRIGGAPGAVIPSGPEPLVGTTPPPAPTPAPPSIFLDHEDVKRLTGFARKNHQIAQLRKMGLPFHVNGRGAPIVARSILEGGSVASAPTGTKEWVPDVLARPRAKKLAPK